MPKKISSQLFILFLKIVTLRKILGNLFIGYKVYFYEMKFIPVKKKNFISSK